MTRAAAPGGSGPDGERRRSGCVVPRGAAVDVDAMKNRLRACASIAEVNAVVREIAPAVMALEAEDRIAAIDIRNLAAYRRICITRDQP